MVTAVIKDHCRNPGNYARPQQVCHKIVKRRMAHYTIATMVYLETQRVHVATTQESSLCHQSSPFRWKVWWVSGKRREASLLRWLFLPIWDYHQERGDGHTSSNMFSLRCCLLHPWDKNLSKNWNQQQTRSTTLNHLAKHLKILHSCMLLKVRSKIAHGYLGLILSLANGKFLVRYLLLN